ncbi:hypothetical protein BC835DRAFT_1530441 [Cytidiella melzeri]|nr:hypothetical protein BC835DRAFT_1530441 [Cytidiella melzeri]
MPPARCNDVHVNKIRFRMRDIWSSLQSSGEVMMSSFGTSSWPNAILWRVSSLPGSLDPPKQSNLSLSTIAPSIIKCTLTGYGDAYRDGAMETRRKMNAACANDCTWTGGASCWPWGALRCRAVARGLGKLHVESVEMFAALRVYHSLLSGCPPALRGDFMLLRRSWWGRTLEPSLGLHMLLQPPVAGRGGQNRYHRQLARKDEEKWGVQRLLYCAGVGKAIHLTIATRPDIFCAVRELGFGPCRPKARRIGLPLSACYDIKEDSDSWDCDWVVHRDRPCPLLRGSAQLDWGISEQNRRTSFPHIFVKRSTVPRAQNRPLGAPFSTFVSTTT